MLEYMTKIWRAYIEKNDSTNSKNLNSSQKEFKLPPIYPIVFYDGPNNWTASKDFKDKVYSYDAFKKFIPDFEYELIDLVGDITFKQLEQLSDEISLLLTFDKLKTSEDIEEAKQINKKVWENIKIHLEDSNILQIIGDSIKSFMENIEASQEEIKKIIEMLYEGKVDDMFEMAVHYSVREIREETQKELEKKWLKKTENLEKNWLNEKENLKRSWLTKEEEYLADKKQLVRTLLELTDIQTASEKTGLSIEEINELKK